MQNRGYRWEIRCPSEEGMQWLMPTTPPLTITPRNIWIYHDDATGAFRPDARQYIWLFWQCKKCRADSPPCFVRSKGFTRAWSFTEPKFEDAIYWIMAVPSASKDASGRVHTELNGVTTFIKWQKVADFCEPWAWWNRAEFPMSHRHEGLNFSYRNRISGHSRNGWTTATRMN